MGGYIRKAYSEPILIPARKPRIFKPWLISLVHGFSEVGPITQDGTTRPEPLQQIGRQLPQFSTACLIIWENRAQFALDESISYVFPSRQWQKPAVYRLSFSISPSEKIRRIFSCVERAPDT